MTRFFLLAASTIALAGCATVEAAPIAAAPAAVTGEDQPAPDTMRWLYGSGEAAGASIQTWRQLADYTIAVSRQRSAPRSVPLGLPDAAGGIGTPSCVAEDGTAKPFAAVFDVDETVLLNTGYEYWQALTGKGFDPDEWKQWADEGAGIAPPVPGAVTGLRRLREAGITVIFNTNRNSDTAAGTVAALEAAGAGPAVHLETLYLRGDDDMGSRKDGRRAMIAETYCVIAMAGDNLGDFADVFNADESAIAARRAMVARGEYAQLWGNGWFLMPNPVYGGWQHGSVGEVFPPATRWKPTPGAAPAIMERQ
ncbi:5'-nucleotidase, lipoprotein e(P4) family [Qipengyuania profunda]|jgi:5'-nucleotidase (lipoprotein e(P4) family)|uniref:5'-nucleotidase, lipoprotein e(P4) family n=1 Tax=Qipengyuania profunda TaxID=3113984 RepID=UPI002A18AE80|nr:HAD family acid phosphatase [Qipengyuania sp. HL-TH1]WPL57633.1 HAD family acid phosphatase [Qipengyuania sp. HL-TH5]